MLPNIVLACYLACAAWLTSSVYGADAQAARGRCIAGLAFGVIAVVLHAGLLWDPVFTRRDLNFTIGQAASLASWLTSLIALWLTLARPRFAVITACLIAMGGVVAAISNGWEIAAHVVLSMLAYALLSVAIALDLAMEWLNRRLHSRRGLAKASMLPSLEALESATFQVLAAGFSVLTFALFSGFLFVRNLSEQHLMHKAILSCLSWLIFGALLYGRRRFGWRGRLATCWALSAFVLLGLGYFGSKAVLERMLGTHWG